MFRILGQSGNIARLPVFNRLAGRIVSLGACLAIMLAVFLAPAGLVGCAGYGNLTTGSDTTTDKPASATIPALSAREQDPRINPRLVWLPRDNQFASWWEGTVADGWIGAGQHYAGSQGMLGRVDYYSGDGKLKWTYRRPAGADDICYQCAARRPDGSVIAGGRLAAASGPEIGLLTAFDESGRMIWETRLTDPDDKNLGLTISQCLITADGRILTVATTQRFDAGNGKQPTIVTCFDADGRKIWQEKLDFQGLTYNHLAVLTEDGGLYLSLYGFSRQTNQMSVEYNWVLRLDRNGKELWRSPLNDETYQYEVKSLVLDSTGSLFISCAARYSGSAPTPTPPANPAIFHDRFRYLSFHPAALLKMDDSGHLVWKKYVNGEFGAYGQQVFCNDQTIYWRAWLIDDIVPPYVMMSIDHRSVGHAILAVLDPGSGKLRYHQFTAAESGSQMVLGIENGQPVLIGTEPFIPPKEWATETFIPGQPLPETTVHAQTSPAASGQDAAKGESHK